MTYGPTTIYQIFKVISTATSIGVSNPKDEIHKVTISKFGKMSRFFNSMFFNYTTIIGKVRSHENHFRHILELFYCDQTQLSTTSLSTPKIRETLE